MKHPNEKKIRESEEMINLHNQLEELIKKEESISLEFVSEQKKQKYLTYKMDYLILECKNTEKTLSSLNEHIQQQFLELNSVRKQIKELEKKVKNWNELDVWIKNESD